MARATAVLATIILALMPAAPAAAHQPRDGDPSPLVRGKRVSGVAQKFAHRTLGSGSGLGTGGTAATCSTPGSGNYLADCHTGGAPVNEPALAASPDGALLVAGANDYNSYNGQGQDGFYWSSDGKTWNDAGPLDVFPHDPNNGAGDPGVAVDANGVIYYSSIFINFNRCDIGGVELMRRDPATGTWSRYEIASNSSAQFQDKPALAVDSAHVFVSWTQFGACDGENVASPIKVAVFPVGGASVAPLSVLSVPGSTYSQGSALAPDGSGGVWVAWEEFPTSTNTVGAIKLAHWDGSGWNVPQTVSPASFKDLPSPLPGFAFRTNSFPSLAVIGGKPVVAWASADGGAGRVSVWAGGSVSQVAPSGGDEFFPAVAADGSGGYYVAYGQTTSVNRTYDWYLAHGSDVSRVSTASSNPSGDFYFGGKFVGDYSALAVTKGVPHAAWADLRSPGLLGYRMDAMTSSPVPPPPDFTLSVTPAAQTVDQGASTTYQVSVKVTGGFSSPVNLSASGLPTGATFGFTPNPTSATSTLTVTTSSQTPAGTYSFTVLGVSGALTRTTTATVTVQASAQPDFALSASPATQSVSPGGSASYAVSITRTGGFPGSVTLSANGLPSGATFSFSPNPATSSSTLTVQTASSSAAGTYTVTIFGLSGSTSHSTTVTLVVQSNGGDFSLSASPSSRTVNQGSSTSYGITIMPSGGFNGQVNLSASGLPSGATFSFSPNPAATHASPKPYGPDVAW